MIQARHLMTRDLSGNIKTLTRQHTILWQLQHRHGKGGLLANQRGHHGQAKSSIPQANTLKKECHQTSRSQTSHMISRIRHSRTGQAKRLQRQHRGNLPLEKLNFLGMLRVNRQPNHPGVSLRLEMLVTMATVIASPPIERFIRDSS